MARICATRSSTATTRETRLYEQFAGFYDLEPLIIADIAPASPDCSRSAARGRADTGREVVKQADVLMLHHLVPDEVAPGSLAPNLDYYEPRTAHGSSLSPGVHASLLARAGRLTPRGAPEAAPPGSISTT